MSFPVDSAGSLAVADLTGTGNLDLVLLASGNSIVVIPGNGDGSFGKPVRYTGLGRTAASVAVGDVNGDGIPDLVVAYAGWPRPPRAPGGVSVLLGNGDGTFQNAVNYDAPSLVAADTMALADLNGDGFLDVVTGNYVFLGQGDGSFGPASYYDVGGVLAVGDFNGDGIPDLATASGDVRILLGNGDGTFYEDSHYSVGQSPQDIAVGDFNGDGFPDLATANFDSNNVSVLLNAADWGNAPRGPTRPGVTAPSTAGTSHAAALQGFLGVGERWKPSSVSSSLTRPSTQAADQAALDVDTIRGSQSSAVPGAQHEGCITAKLAPDARRVDPDAWEFFLDEVALRQEGFPTFVGP
jgi:hypothetical protein